MKGKKELRQELLQARKQYAVHGWQTAIAAQFLAFYETMKFENRGKPLCVFCYISRSWEVPTDEIVNQLLADGACVCVPRCIGAGQMEAVVIASRDELEKGTYGIAEPKSGNRVIGAKEIDVCIVPGLAYDIQGYRIGMGGGYYDRFLRQVRETCETVGLMYDTFVLENVPHDVYDVAVKHILTETGFRKMKGKVLPEGQDREQPCS